MNKKEKLRIREKLILLHQQHPNEDFEFEAVVLSIKNEWITFSQLKLNNELIATHFNLPSHLIQSDFPITPHSFVKFKGKGWIYRKNGKNIGTIKPSKGKQIVLHNNN